MNGGADRVRWVRRRSRTVVAVCVGLLGLSLAGCGGAGPSTPTASGSATVSASPSITAAAGGPAVKDAAEATALMADYDVRNNAAIAKGVSFDTSGWQSADTGLALAADIMNTRLQQARSEPSAGTPVTHADAQPWAPDITGSPQWVLISATSGGKPKLYGFVRESASDPWRQESYVSLTEPLPAPAAPGSAATPSAAQIAAAQDAAAQVATTVSAGGQGPIALVGTAATMVKRLDSDRSGLGAESLTLTATPDPAQGLRVALAADGSTIALASHRVTATFTARSGSSLEHAPDFAAVLGQTGPQQQLVYHYALFSVLKVTPGAGATMLASNGGNLLPTS